ncbi:MAG: ATP-binding protein [Candidatus Riflebacteria bacterium]|nr:ATP-binding protein [Candidatus Riflebacteria bacterium]
MARSFFLFGPRGTGKSTLLRQLFSDRETLWIDLLNPEEEDRLARRPMELSERIGATRPHPEWVVIDEVQKAPRLLDVVHGEIERDTVKFALTGSSARRLKRQSTNLLAGRATVHHLFPFTATEMGRSFDLDATLRFGSLPGLLACPTDDDRRAFLRSYALTYLKEEVWAEHLVRRLDPFRRFLEIAAQANGEILNFTRIARDVGADVKTAQSYFQLLEDTLVGFLLEPFHQSVRKRQTHSPKFFFFDLGVKRALTRMLTVDLVPGTYDYGRAFEHFVIVEAARRSAYRQNDYALSYLRTKDDAEIDLVVERPGMAPALVEIKSSDRVDERDTRTVDRFLKDLPGATGFCLSRDPIAKVIGSVRALPWWAGLEELAL